MRVVILLLAILALSAFVGCQSKPMAGSDVQSGSEGIKVHGNWTVEVTNPDGSLATRKQFTNSFDGKHIVAFLLSYDPETVEREMGFNIKDQPYGGSNSSEAKCTGSLPFSFGAYGQRVHANAIHAPNDDGDLYNSVWSASCTLEISGNEPKFITDVSTIMESTPIIIKYDGDDGIHTSGILSKKTLTEPIKVWDGQIVAATVILSVE